MDEPIDEKVACVECGKPVSAKLASRRGGLCLRCSANRNPFFVLYGTLIDRVCNSPGGFDSLSRPEKIYYAVTLFRNEINNGGFHQFFFNSSGSYYDLIENSLITFEEPKLRELLHKAKQTVFPEVAVPTETTKRRELLLAVDPNGDLIDKLDPLDQQCYQCADTLSSKLEAFAREKGLISA